MPEGEGTTDDPEAKRALKRLYEVLDKIDDRGRLAFTLRFFEGYELTEVAEALGCSLATTKRALAKTQERVHALVKREPLLAPYLQNSQEDGLEETEVGDAAQGD
jgi:RNA polymerase sigma-70 factor (ECF subfamily)